MRLARLLAAPLLLVASLPAARAAAQAPDAARDTAAVDADTATIAIRFGWTAGTVSQVETIRQRVRVSDGRSDTTRSGARYTMRVEPHADGLLVRYADLTVPALDADTSAQARTAREFMARTANLMPSFVVGADAELLRLENVAQLQAFVDSLFAPMLAEMPDAPVNLRTMLQSLRSEEGLTALAAQEWNMLVGTWVGGELEPGEVYGYEAEEPVPLLGGATIPTSYEFGIVETLPCTDAADAPVCVALVMHSAPDPEAMKALLARFMEQITTGTMPGGVAFEELDVATSLAVVLEPDTMRPYRLRSEKRLSGTVRAGAEGTQPVSQVDERVSIFTYPAAGR